MDLNNYNYTLPEHLIAKYPQEKRDQSKLLVLNKKTGDINKTIFKNITDLITENDLIVVNNTKVINARLFGYKKDTGGKTEVFLLHPSENENVWSALSKPFKRLKEGQEIIFNENPLFKGIIQKKLQEGKIEIELSSEYKDIDTAIENFGNIPLPPYLNRESEEEDKIRYQTVYAEKKGAAAAPTAGLHFTQNLITELKNKGADFAEVLLHVGLGTFRPIEADNINEHKMHSEYFEINDSAAEKINKAKKDKKRIIAVGTTSVRALESAAVMNSDNKFTVQPVKRETDIFIYPPYKFKIIDALITNFHLPKSTLLLLVSALGGYHHIMNAYKYAVENEFRFYSYGDAMFIY